MARIKDNITPGWEIFKRGSKEDRSCQVCQRGFGESTYVIAHRPRRVSWWYHIECCVDEDHPYAKPSYTGELRGFEILSKQVQNKITRILWPHQVSKSQRAQLRLIRCVDQLNADELAIELEKRDIQIRIIRIHCGDPSTEEECHGERQKKIDEIFE